jgi:hypothetical protein
VRGWRRTPGGAQSWTVDLAFHFPESMLWGRPLFDNRIRCLVASGDAFARACHPARSVGLQADGCPMVAARRRGRSEAGSSHPVRQFGKIWRQTQVFENPRNGQENLWKYLDMFTAAAPHPSEKTISNQTFMDFTFASRAITRPAPLRQALENVENHQENPWRPPTKPQRRTTETLMLSETCRPPSPHPRLQTFQMMFRSSSGRPAAMRSKAKSERSSAR